MVRLAIVHRKALNIAQDGAALKGSPLRCSTEMVSMFSYLPENTHAIKRQEPTEPDQHASEDLFDSLDFWLKTPHIAYTSWLSRQTYAASTKTVYIAMFTRFCEWLGEQGKRLDRCEKDDLCRFLDTANPNLPESRRRPQTGLQRQQYVRQLERVFVHLNALGLRGQNPGRQAAYDKVGQGRDKPTRFLSREERDAVIRTIEQSLTRLELEDPDLVPWTDFRDLALVSLLLGAGLKVSHIERLTINCIDMHEERIDLSLPRYTHRARIMVFAMAPLRAWLLIQAKRRGGEVRGTHPVFEGDRSVGFGRTAKSLFMHASSIHRRTQRCLEAAGVTGDRACAQTLRNTYAGLLIDAGASDEELVDFMGLKASVTSTRLRQAYAQSKSRHEPVVSTPHTAHPNLKTDQLV